MVGKMTTQNPDGMLTYPSSRDVLKVVRLKTINHYIGVHWEIIARFILDQPLFAFCRDGERKRGLVHCTFWWEQLCQLMLRSHYHETKTTRMMINIFVRDNLFDWANCMGRP